jgi:hypothetical protein
MDRIGNLSRTSRSNGPSMENYGVGLNFLLTPHSRIEITSNQCQPSGLRLAAVVGVGGGGATEAAEACGGNERQRREDADESVTTPTP